MAVFARVTVATVSLPSPVSVDSSSTDISEALGRKRNRDSDFTVPPDSEHDTDTHGQQQFRSHSSLPSAECPVLANVVRGCRPRVMSAAGAQSVASESAMTECRRGNFYR